MKVIIVLCTLFMSLNAYGSDRKDIMMVDRHVNDFAAKMSKKGYYLFGSGGQMMDNIKKVCLDFDLQEKADVEKARRLIVAISEDFLAIINADEQLRPFLVNYPFDHRNISFTIAFKDENHRFRTEGVACAMICGNSICYSKSPKLNEPLEEIYFEKYVDALEKVKQEQKSTENKSEIQ